VKSLWIGLAAWVTVHAFGIAGAAPSSQVAVDRQGALSIPAATLRALKIKPAANGMVCLRFPTPSPPAPRPPRPGQKPAPAKAGAHDGHNHSLAAIAPRIWTTVRPDGSVRLAKGVLGGNQNSIPGPAGAVYVVTADKGHVVLSKPGKAPAHQ